MRDAEWRRSHDAGERAVDVELHTIDIRDGRRHFDWNGSDRLTALLRRDKRDACREHQKDRLHAA